MTDGELELLLDDVESDRIERKSSDADTDKIRQTICAFANDLPNHGAPGILFVGVNDRGSPTGLSITDGMLQKLASFRADGTILPFPSLDVQKRRLKGDEVAVVLVHPAVAPPVRYKGTVWIRSGPRRGIASPDDESRLNEKRRYRDVPFDLRPLESARLDQLDELLFRRSYLPSAIDKDVLLQNERTLEHQLLAVKFAHQGPPICPTVLGMLAIGITPTDFVPGAFIQFIRIDGTEIGDPILDQRVVQGSLVDQLEELESIVRANIRVTSDFTTSELERRQADYPLVALQQVVRNAIQHRSYENTHSPTRISWYRDRIEVQNPGGPFGLVNKANFGQPGASDYRNPNLAAVMKELGYVQRFGFGLQIAKSELQKNGNPPLEFQIEDAHVLVSVGARP